MTDSDLRRRVELLRNDYENVMGTAFEHFYCPILRVDDNVPLCRGHVIPKSTGTSNVWVPQRQDVDHFYGTMIEADFLAIVRDRSKNIHEFLSVPQLNLQFRPRIMLNDTPLDYFPAGKTSNYSGHTPVQIVAGNDSEQVSNIVVKLSADEMLDLVDKQLNLVIEGDYRPATIAAVLKSAHLTMFRMLGYDHILSSAGEMLAQILRDFFIKHRHLRRRELRESIDSYFCSYANMVIPLQPGTSSIEGTVADNLALACIGASGRIFAFAVFVRVLTDVFCVFLPNNSAEDAGTYFGFLNQRPPSFAAQFVRYVPASDQRESHWEIPKSEPFRITFPSGVAV